MFRLPGGPILLLLDLQFALRRLPWQMFRQSKVVGLTILVAVLDWTWLSQTDRTEDGAVLSDLL